MVAQKLIKYLKEKKVYDKFLENYRKPQLHEQDESIFDLWGAFLWESTTEKFEFWNNIQKEYDKWKIKH